MYVFLSRFNIIHFYYTYISGLVAKISLIKHRDNNKFSIVRPIITTKSIDNSNTLYFYCYENHYLLPVILNDEFFSNDNTIYTLFSKLTKNRIQELVFDGVDNCEVVTNTMHFKLKLLDIFKLSFSMQKPIHINNDVLQMYGYKITKEILINALNV